MDLKLTKTKPENWGYALAVARLFDADYPNRNGLMAGVVYTAKGRPAFYAYRTKTSIVVRGDLEGAQ